MIIIDSSVWINHDRAIDTPASLALLELLGMRASPVATTDPVYMELLAGTTNEFSRRRVKSMLFPLAWIPIRPEADFEGASMVFAKCRANGLTVSSMVDCMIANIAIRTESSVLTDDGDFAKIAEVTPLRLHLV